MNNDLLLELTEKEIQMLKFSLEKERDSLISLNNDHKQEEYRKKIEVCEASLAKIELALEPKKDVLITSKDFFLLKDLATGSYTKLPGTLNLSNKKVDESDFVHISVANALIMWLNGKNLLKKVVKFDNTDR